MLSWRHHHQIKIVMLSLPNIMYITRELLQHKQCMKHVTNVKNFFNYQRLICSKKLFSL